MQDLMNQSRKLFAATLMAATLAGSPVFAEGDQVGESPWGPEDEIGTLNMMSDTSRMEILQRIDAGKIYDLGVELFIGMPDCCSAAFGDTVFGINRSGYTVLHDPPPFCMTPPLVSKSPYLEIWGYVTSSPPQARKK